MICIFLKKYLQQNIAHPFRDGLYQNNSTIEQKDYAVAASFANSLRITLSAPPALNHSICCSL